MKLSKVIEKIECYIKEKHPVTKAFTHPQKLVDALHELDDMVEMDTAKTIISKHIRHIIVTKKLKNELLNTMIYGPPGVGKTEVGIILAKIWASLGILKKKPNKPSRSMPDFKTAMENEVLKHRHGIVKKRYKRLRNNPRGDLLEHIQRHSSELSSVESIPHFLENLSTNILNSTHNKRKLGNDWIYTIDSLNSAVRYFQTSQTKKEVLNTIYRTVTSNEMTLTDPIEPPEDKMDDELPFVLAKPHDFIGQYIGETAIKSEEFLKKHAGKVIFIDEAYTLAEKRYGLEALTVITRAITEHPERNIFEFGGYKEQMRQISEVQPGLDRRCSFVIEIKEYSPDGLMKIFEKQLKEHTKTIGEEYRDDINRHFVAHKDKYTHYGGDTKKLAYYCNVEHSLDVFEKADLDNTCLTYKQFESGFNSLIQNKADTPDDTFPKHLYI